METITVIGAGTAGLAFCEKLRQINPASKITLIDKNKYHFAKSDTISQPGDISRRVDLNQWSEEKGIEFIQAQVDRINPKSKKIFFKKLETREYTLAVLATGLKSKKLPIKGEHREGFFYLSQIDPLRLKDLFRISAEATVCLSSWLGLRLVLSLLNLGKEVNLIAEHLDFLGAYKEKVVSFLEAKKVKFYLGASLEEAVGESMVKAAKISPLKVFSSQLVFIDSGFTANNQFFEQDLTVRDKFFTEYEDLYCLGDVSNANVDGHSFFVFNDQQNKQEGAFLAAYLVDKKNSHFEPKTVGSEDRDKFIENIISLLEQLPAGH